MEGEFLLKALETLGVPAAICFGLMFWIRKDIRDLTFMRRESPLL